MVVFAKNDESTFKSVNGWMESIYRHKGTEVPIILVGNKCDEPDVSITKEMGQSLAYDHKIDYFETSIKDVISIKAAFDDLCEKMCNLKDSQLIAGTQPQDIQPTIRLGHPIPPQ